MDGVTTRVGRLALLLLLLLLLMTIMFTETSVIAINRSIIVMMMMMMMVIIITTKKTSQLPLLWLLLTLRFRTTFRVCRINSHKTYNAVLLLELNE